MQLGITLGITINTVEIMIINGNYQEWSEPDAAELAITIVI